jgi:hypothetical protein
MPSQPRSPHECIVRHFPYFKPVMFKFHQKLIGRFVSRSMLNNLSIKYLQAPDLFELFLPAHGNNIQQNSNFAEI